MQLSPDDLVRYLEVLLKNEFRGLSPDIIRELTNEAVVFILTSGATEIAPEQVEELVAHLREYLSRGKEDSVSNLMDPRDEPVSVEEWLSRALLKPGDTGLGDKTELEKIFELPEKARREEYLGKLEDWRKALPEAEYEALTLVFGAESSQRWTWGLAPTGLRILFMRALARIRWQDAE